jgi:hypothetical protein
MHVDQHCARPFINSHCHTITIQCVEQEKGHVTCPNHSVSCSSRFAALEMLCHIAQGKSGPCMPCAHICLQRKPTTLNWMLPLQPGHHLPQLLQTHTNKMYDPPNMLSLLLPNSTCSHS